MKRIIFIIISVTAMAGIFLVQACKKEKSPSHVAHVSFPVITLLGAPDTTINRGVTWVDPGATWVDDTTGEHGTLTVSVNTSKDSAYLLVYTATNKNGFQSTVTRGLAVTNMDNNIDISGLYNDGVSIDSVYKVSRALFYHPNVDLNGDAGLVAIKSDSTLSVATIITAYTGAPVAATFSQAQINYVPPFSFQYTVTILNSPPYAATFSQ